MDIPKIHESEYRRQRQSAANLDPGTERGLGSWCGHRPLHDLSGIQLKSKVPPPHTMRRGWSFTQLLLYWEQHHSGTPGIPRM